MKKFLILIVFVITGFMAATSGAQEQNAPSAIPRPVVTPAGASTRNLPAVVRTFDHFSRLAVNRPGILSFDDSISALNGPSLTWHTFVGGTGSDGVYGIAVDSSGNTYLAGWTYATWGSPVRAYTGGLDAYVAKLGPNGALLWHTFLGGTGGDWAIAIAVDANGNSYVTGDSQAAWGTPVRAYTGGDDAFVAKVDGNGVLQWNTFLGESKDDCGYGIALDAAFNVFVGGTSSGPNWGSPVSPYSAVQDGFAAKLNNSGVLQWNSFQGGAGDEGNNGVAVDGNGNVYVSGPSFTATWGSPIRAYSGGFDGHVAKLNGSGVLQWNTFFGGTGNDTISRMVIDSNWNIFVAGEANATWGTPVRAHTGGKDAFAAKVDASGVLQWNTFLGGSGDDTCLPVAVDSGGNVYIGGNSPSSWGLPVWAYVSGADAFAVKLNGSGVLQWNAFFGGSQNDYGCALCTDANGNVYFSGYAGATWGTPVSPFKTAYDGFVDKISDPSTTPTIQLNRPILNFGAVAGGVATSSQKLLVSNSGKGTLNWGAASGSAWVTVTPASGTGTGVIQVGVNPAGLTAGLTAGSYRGTVTVTDPNASNSPQTVTVNLIVYPAGASAVPYGEFATPVEGTTGITGAIPVTGWILDDVETTKVEIWRDPVLSAGELNSLYYVGDGLFVEGARPDVEAGYPAYPWNYRAGWGYMLLTNFLPLQGNGTYKLYAIATDKEGNRVVLGAKTIACDNAHATKPFGTIDTPAQGGDASGSPVLGAKASAFVNFGWVLTPQPKLVPKDGSTIDVYVDSVKLGNLATLPNVYDQYRVDVSTSFPGLKNSGGPVGAFFLDTTKYTNGVHTIFWIATDDEGKADGIGSRYFNVLNAGGAAERKGDTHFWDTSSRDRTTGYIDRRETNVDLARRSVYPNDVLNLPRSYEPLSIKRGFDRVAPVEAIKTGDDRSYHIDIKEVELLRIFLDPARAEKDNPPSSPFRKGGEEGKVNPLSPSDSAVNAGDRRARGDLTSKQDKIRIIPLDPPLEKGEKDTGSSEMSYSGFLIVGDELRPLPIGSTLDAGTGLFSWLPGPGFIGSYDLVFVEKNAFGTQRAAKVKVTIKPKF